MPAFEPFAQMLHELREPLLIAAPDGRILAANAAGADALGTSSEALDGANVAGFAVEPALLGERLRDRNRPFALRTRDGRRFNCDVRALAPDVLLLRLSGGPGAMLWDRRFFETARHLDGANDGSLGAELSERAMAQLTRMQAFTSALASAITPVEVTEAVVDMGTVAAGARSGRLWLMSPDGTTVCLARAVGHVGVGDDHDLPIDRSPRLPVVDSIRDAAPVWLESRAELEQRYPELGGDGDEAVANVPLFTHGRCIGVLVFTYDGSHTFGDDERSFLQVLAGYAAQAIDRARLFAAEQRARRAAEASQRRSEFLANASKLLASALDYTSALTGVAQAAVPRIADWCIVELQEESLQGHPSLAVHVDPTKNADLRELGRRVRRLNLNHGIPSVVSEGRSAIYPSITPEMISVGLRADPELAELYAKTGLVSSMIVPITANGRVLGAIVLSSATPTVQYDEHDLAMAEELGRRAGLAVENARLYRAAREADRRKDEFLAMLSHELRNPLAPIVTALDLMELRIGDACEREREIVSRQVQHLVRLVGDLLNVARVTRGEIQLENKHLEMSHVIARAVEMAAPLFDDRSQQLQIAVPSAGLVVEGDLERLAQAVANLLINASKYGESGGVVTLVAEPFGTEAVVRVRDTGIGIAAETLPAIFDLFVQEAARSNARKVASASGSRWSSASSSCIAVRSPHTATGWGRAASS